MLSPEALELLLEPVSCLPGFSDHLCKVLSQLEFILGQGHDIGRDIFILLPEHVILSHSHTLVHLEDLLG